MLVESRVIPAGSDASCLKGLLGEAEATGHVNALLHAQRRKTFHVLLSDGAPVAVCWTRKYPFGFGADGGLYVAPAVRGMGHARHVTRDARAYLAAMGVKRLVVAAHTDRPARLAALQRQGFRVIVARTPSLAGARPGRILARTLAALLGMAPAKRPVAVLFGRLAPDGSVTSACRGTR